MNRQDINETVCLETKFTQGELDKFAEITGDNNPIHTAAYHANNPLSKGVIVHGMLALSRFGAYLGGVFPGHGTINVSRSAQFLRPVYVGKTYFMCLTLTHVDTSNNLASIKLCLKNKEGEVCIEGDTEVKNEQVFTEDNYSDTERKERVSIDVITMPTPLIEDDCSLHEAMMNRRSVRYIQKTEIPIQILSNLLWSACGVSQRKDLENGKTQYLYTNPTASNHQEVEVYLFTIDGVFRYDPVYNSLIKYREGDFRSQIGKLPMFKMAPITLCLVSNYDKMVHHTDTFRKKLYSSMDIGYVSENIYLFCAANNMATCACGQIAREDIANILSLDNSRVMLVHPIGMRKNK